MLARITYGLVIIALGCLIGGFFTRESNVLLFVSIGLSVVAIALVLVGWARRAREAPVGFEEEVAYDEEEEALVDALSDEELAFVEERAPRRARRPAARPRTKPKAGKPKAAKPKAKAAAAKSKAKAKPAARKAKPKTTTRKPQARPKRKPPRPRPETP